MRKQNIKEGLMDALVLSKVVLVHFTTAHSLLAAFHCTVGRYLYDYVHTKYGRDSMQFVYSVPHDIVFTTMIVYITYIDSKPLFWDALQMSVAPTLSVTALCELRVLFYFGDFPQHVAASLCAVRSLVYMLANAAAFFVVFDW